MNSKGMTAFVDVMIFLLVIMMAIAVAVGQSHVIVQDGSDPDGFLGDLGSIKVRLSDFTDIEDDSLVFLTDVMAYSTVNNSSVGEYLESFLDSAFGKNRYHLTFEYNGNTKALGRNFKGFEEEASRSFAVSIGGSIDVRLKIC